MRCINLRLTYLLTYLFIYFKKNPFLRVILNNNFKVTFVIFWLFLKKIYAYWSYGLSATYTILVGCVKTAEAIIVLHRII